MSTTAATIAADISAIVEKSIPKTKPVQNQHSAGLNKPSPGSQFRLFSVQLLCLGGAGAIAKTAVAPLERIKMLLQVQPISITPKSLQYKGLLDALQQILVREGGYKALYRGNGANVLRLVPEIGFKYALHDQLQVMFAPSDGTLPGVTQKLVTSSAAGLFKTALLYPLDLACTRIATDSSLPGQARTYGTVRSCLADTFRSEGVIGLYKGMGISLLVVVPYFSLSFAAYDQLKLMLPEDQGPKLPWWNALLKLGCGSAAAVSAQTLLYPADTVRRRLQLSRAKGFTASYQGFKVLDCVRSMIRTEGVSSFYRGCLVNCLRTTPGMALQFVAYDLIKVGVNKIDPTAGMASPL